MKNNRTAKESTTVEQSKEFTVVELKAMAYDAFVEIKRLENIYQAIQIKLREKLAEEAK